MDFSEVYEDTVSAVATACRNGDAEVLKGLLIQLRDIDIKDNRGWLPLHEAANSGSVSCIVSLLKHQHKLGLPGSQLEEKSFEGLTPLMLASRKQNTAAVRSLVTHGANVTARSLSGASPISLAVAPFTGVVGEQLSTAVKDDIAANLLKVMLPYCPSCSPVNTPCEPKRLIAEFGHADITVASDYTGFTALHHAVVNGLIECTRLLLRHRFHPRVCCEKDQKTSIFLCAQLGSDELLQFILSQFTLKPKGTGRSRYNWSALNDNEKAVLERKRNEIARVVSGGFAAVFGHSDMRGGEDDGDNEREEGPHEPAGEDMLWLDSPSSSDDEDRFQEAPVGLRTRSLSNKKRLAQASIPLINVSSRGGMMPLEAALKGNHITTAKVLLEYGADPLQLCFQPDRAWSDTILGLIIWMGDLSLFEEAMKCVNIAGFNVTAAVRGQVDVGAHTSTKHPITALLWFRKSDYAEIEPLGTLHPQIVVDAFVQCGADINAVGRRELSLLRNALYFPKVDRATWIVSQSSRDLVFALLKYGARVIDVHWRHHDGFFIPMGDRIKSLVPVLLKRLLEQRDSNWLKRNAGTVVGDEEKVGKANFSDYIASTGEVNGVKIDAGGKMCDQSEQISSKNQHHVGESSTQPVKPSLEDLKRTAHGTGKKRSFWSQCSPGSLCHSPLLELPYLSEKAYLCLLLRGAEPCKSSGEGLGGCDQLVRKDLPRIPFTPEGGRRRQAMVRWLQPAGEREPGEGAVRSLQHICRHRIRACLRRRLHNEPVPARLASFDAMATDSYQIEDAFPHEFPQVNKNCASVVAELKIPSFLQDYINLHDFVGHFCPAEE